MTPAKIATMPGAEDRRPDMAAPLHMGVLVDLADNPELVQLVAR
jgi:hypothetical protein